MPCACVEHHVPRASPDGQRYDLRAFFLNYLALVGSWKPAHVAGPAHQDRACRELSGLNRGPRCRALKLLDARASGLVVSRRLAQSAAG